MMLNIQGVFYSPSMEKPNMTGSTDSRERKRKNHLDCFCLFVQFETLRHAPAGTEYTNQFIV